MSVGLVLQKDLGRQVAGITKQPPSIPFSHCSEGEIEAQRGLMTCTKSYSKMVAARIQPKSLSLEPVILPISPMAAQVPQATGKIEKTAKQ